MFIENKGQTDERAKLYLRSGRQTLWLTNEGVVFDLLRATDSRATVVSPEARRTRQGSVPRERLVFTQEFLDPNRGVTIEPKQLLPGTHNYYLDNDPSRWRRGVRQWGEVVYRDIWAGIDLRLHSNGRHLEQEFVVRPGGDASRIRVAYRGIEGLRIAEDGALVIRTAFGELKESAPTIYQEIDDKRVAVTGRFKLLGPTAYTFEVGPYEPRYALVIDPTLVYKTYLGGSLDDNALGIAVDGDGRAYLAGSTNSTNFPTQNGLFSYSGGSDVFVTRLNRTGTALQFSTYVGGSGDDNEPAIAIDTAGGAYVVGSTTSTDFPTLSAFQPSLGGGRDAFVFSIDPIGVLRYSTYLGGAGDETGVGIVVDPSCVNPSLGCGVYVSGTTASAFLPASGFQPTFAGVRDAFIVKLDATGSTRLASTYLGGSGAEDAGVLAVGADGSVYVTGQTSSTNFPFPMSPNALQSSLNGPADAFIVKLSADLSTRLYATYFGGSGTDGANQIVVDSAGNMFVAGQTNSIDLGFVSAVQETPGGDFDAFVLKLNPTGSTVLYLTYLGGSGFDDAFSIALDDAGNAHVTGKTAGSLPTNLALDTSPQPAIGSGGGTGTYVAKLSPSGNQLLYLTYLGGASNEDEGMIAVDAARSAYVAIGTFANNLASGFLAFAGGEDGYVVKLGTQSADVSVTKFGNPSPVLSGSNLTYTITVTNGGPDSAVNVTLTDVVPAGTTFQSLTPNTGCATPPVNASGTVSCSLGTLANGASIVFTLVVKVTAPSGSVSNTASVTVLTPDPNAANDAASIATNVTAPGAISGTVCANALPPCGGGNPAIAGATINVRNSDNGFQVATGTTDASGNYTIAGLAPRNYKVSAEANGFGTRFFNDQTSFTTGNLVTVNAGATTGGINFGLPGSAGGIAGKVTLADGVTAVPNAQVSARGTGGEQILFTTTDAGGNYNTQRRLVAGNYLIRVSATGFPVTYYVAARSSATATQIPVAANSDTTGKDVKLSPEVGGISGRVTSATTGAPLAAVGVTISDGATGGFIQGFTTDASGNYTTGLALAPGQYKVSASVAGSETIAYNNKFSVATGDPVTVVNGSTTTGIDLALPLLGGITGHVTNAQTAAPIQGAVVDVFDYAANFFVRSTATAADGSYTITNLNPLQAYRVRARLGNFGLVFYNGKPSAGTADVVTVPAGATTTLDFALSAAGGILGTVTDAATSSPIQGVEIAVFDGASTNFSINNFVNFSVTTDASGNFNTGRVLAPGVYKVRARKFNSGYIQTFSPSGFDLSTAATATVSAGADTTNVNIAMQMGGTITGTILDRASGQPIAGASVNLIRVGSSNFFGDFTVTTNAAGNYTITGLHTGEWLVYAQATGHMFAWYSGDANNPATSFSNALPVEIASASIVNNVNLSLALGGGAIRGRVTRSDNGQPVPTGTAVRVRGWPLAASVLNISPVTNAQGDYSLSGLPPGRYFVEADRFQIANGTAIGFFPFGSVSRTTGTPITVTDGGVVTADFQVLGFSGNAAPRSITGTLKDTTNAPIRNAYVVAAEPTGLSAVRVVGAFDDGSFAMDGLAPGRYLISILTEKTFVSVVYPSELTRETGTLIDVTAGDASGINLVAPNNAGTITGTITRSDNGQPLRGASLSVRTVLDAAVPVLATESRIDGTYLIRGAAPGFYKVRVSASGFVTKYYVVGVPGGARTLDEGSFVVVAAGTSTPNINMALDPTDAVLTGTVKRQGTLEPVVAAVVAVHDAATGNRVITVITDASGTWRTENLAPGGYKVGVFDARAARYAAQWYSGQPTLLDADTVTVAAAGVTGGVDFLVSPNQGSISGQVLLSAGATPLANAGVEILDSATGGFVRRALTGSDGRYSAQGLAPSANSYVAHALALGFADQYYLGVSTRAAATPLAVTDGGDTPNINFSLTPPSTADISVTKFGNPSPVLSGTTLTYTITVSNAGPNPAANVSLLDTVPAGTTFQSLSPSVGCTTPAVNGTGTVSCSLGTLASGASVTLTLVVNVTAASGSVSNTSLVAATTPDPSSVNNSAAVTTNIAAPGAISGTVCASSGPPCGGGNPAISGATITVRNSDSALQVATGVTDGSGNYTITGLQPRNYKVSAEANGFATRYFNNQTNFTTGNLVTVNAGATTVNINFGLPTNAGSIGGQVTLTDGTTPVPNAEVAVRTTTSGDILSTTTDSNGNYNTQRRLAAGNYLVRVIADGLAVTYYVSATSTATATQVPVSATADTTGINVKLASSVGGISGRVTSASTGAPLFGVGVTISDGATSGSIGTRSTDASGKYDTGQVLAPGQYKVSANVAGSETIAYNNKFSVATGDPVTVSAGSTTTGIDLALPQLGGITGHVRNAADSSVIQGAVVDVFDYATNTFIVNTTSAADGSYTINNLNPLQAYRVRARVNFTGSNNFATIFANNKVFAGTADVITVPAGATTTLDFALSMNAGGIKGTITDAATSLPVANAIVDIFDGATSNFSINVFITGGFTTGVFITDVNGNFNSGRVLAPGLYKVRVRKTNSGYFQTFYVNGRDLSTATPVNVTANTDFTANVALSLGGTITGTIRDRASNQPLSGSTVIARRVASGSFFGDFTVTTDVNGNYTITGLDPGEWLMTAQATGHILGWYSGNQNNLATDFSTSLPIQISGTSTVTGVNLNLLLGGGQIHGRVTRSDNSQPVPVGTFVNILGPWPRASSVSPAGVATTAQGDYSFSGLPPGRYVVEAGRVQVPNGTAIGFFPFGSVSRSSGVPITVTDGSVVTADFQVLGFTGNATPRSIRGTLRDPSNNPIRTARVFAIGPTATGAIRFNDVFNDGSFVIDGLPPGRYLLGVQIENTFVATVYPAELTANTGTLIDVTAGDVSGINFVLPNNAGTITGTVTRSDTGQPILGASIGVRTFLDSSAGGATSRIDGTFLARAVMPGFYKIRVSAPGFVTKFFKVGVPGGVSTSEDGSFVTVTAGANTPDRNLVLDPTGGALTGTVRDQNTLQPVVATVAVIHDAATGNRVTAVSTDASGVWRTEGVGPGTYKVGITDVQAARHAAQWYSGEGTLLSAEPVTVASVGTTGGIDFLVSPNHGSISGQVSRSDETPLANVVVTFLDSATGGLVRRALVGSTGAYLAEGLAPGSSLYVAQGRALGFADEFFPNVPARTAASPLTVANGTDTPNVNLTLRASADVNGSVSYSGAQTGALVVRLFSDDAFTQQVYETVIPSPSFAGSGQAYGFALPAPDTRGLLPGTYFVKAFLDGDGNGFQDATEAFGTPAGSVTVAEGATAVGTDFSIADPAATTNTSPSADAQMVIFVQGSIANSIILTGDDTQTATADLTYTVTTNPLHGTLTTLSPQQRLYTPNPLFIGTDTFTFTVTDRGHPDNCGAPGPGCSAALTSAPATVSIEVTPNAGTTSLALANPTIPGPSTGSGIGNVQIVENATGALQAGSAIKLSLPAGLTFTATPTVSFKVSNGAALNPPILELPGVVSFTLAARSTTGSASILVSGMSVDVSSGFLADGVTSAAVLTTISGPNPGLTPAIVQNATVVAPAAGPAISSISLTTAGQGASGRVVLIGGANFDVPTASVSFGPGVTAFVSGAPDSSSTQLSVTIAVDAEAPLTTRDVIVTNGSSGLSATQPATFTINPPPTVSSASGGNNDGSLCQNLSNQLVTISGSNFGSPTTSYPVVTVGNPGIISVGNAGYTDATTLTAVLSVGSVAEGLYNLTVTNPDGGSATGVGIVSVVPNAPPNSCGNAPPAKNTSPPPPPPQPAITSLSPSAGALGSSIQINGSGFSATLTSNSVTFAGASGVRVTATVTAATTTRLTVAVPSQATTGNVTVAVGGVLSNGVSFSVTNPVLASVLPASGTQGTIVALALTGLRFQPTASVSFSGTPGDITTVLGPTVSPDGTSIQLSVSIAGGAALVAHDVKVTNPDATSSTLAGAFQIQAPIVAGFLLTLPAFPDNTSTYLPGVDSVVVTRGGTGLCTVKTVTPTAVQLQAQFTTTNPSLLPPASVTFTIVSSANLGTASNETCEVAPYSAVSPSPDWSIGANNVTSQSVVVAGSGGFYLTTLYAYDWGGKVTITVTGITGGVTATGTLALPVDADGDDLPDAYEKNAALNADQNGVNVLNFLNPDQNANAVKDRDDRFMKDGLSNFEKYRGVYLAGPIPGTGAAMGSFQRLGAGLRHLFVRGRGFRDDPAVPIGSCGINPATGAPVTDASFCPAFQVGTAFQSIGVSVHNVSGSFTGTTELPRTSYVSTTTPTLDMATVIYDGVNCKGSEACDTTSKFGVRQWGFNTLGYTTPYGTVSAYGAITVYKRAIGSYFNNRPYQHRINDPSRVVTAPDGTPMLAPITRVGDSSTSGGTDNGLINTGDGTVSGQLAGDTYIAGSFNQQLSAMDVNNDGCIELPTVADPTTIGRCTPIADTATAPSATKQQVLRSVITHELGHGTGVNTHTSDSTDIMYMSTTNFTRDGHFSGTAAALIQIHNKGIQ